MKKIILALFLFTCFASNAVAQTMSPAADYLDYLVEPKITYFQKAIGKPKKVIVENFNTSTKFGRGYQMLTWEEMLKSGDASEKKKGWNLIFVDASNNISPKVTVLFKAPAYTECSIISWTVPIDHLNDAINNAFHSGYNLYRTTPVGNDEIYLFKNGEGYQLSLSTIVSRGIVMVGLEKPEQK